MTVLNRNLIRRLTTPVRLTNKHQPTRQQTPTKQVNSATHPTADPGSAKTRSDINRLISNVTSSIPMHERNKISNTKLNRPSASRRQERRAQIHPGPAQTMITSPSTQQLPRPTSQIKQPSPSRDPQRSTKISKLGAGQRIMDPMTTLPDEVLTRYIHTQHGTRPPPANIPYSDQHA